MAKATIYTITITRASENEEPGTYYSLNPWGANSLYYEGYDDGGKVFSLPKGIAVGRDKNGERILYEKKSGRSVEICDIQGAPVLRFMDQRYILETANP